MTISIVVRTHNDEKFLRETLRGVFSQRLKQPVQYLLIDEGSCDASLSIAKEFPFDVIRAVDRFNGAYSLNAIYKECKGEFIVNILGHTIPAGKTAFSCLVNPLYKQGVAAVYGRQLPHPEGNSFFNLNLQLGYTDKGGVSGVLSLAFSSLKRSVWEKACFKEELVPSEDKGWAKEVINAGYKILYQPEAAVFHYHPFSLIRTFRRAIMVASAHKLMGFSKRSHYFSLHKAIVTDIRYLEKRYLLPISPIYHALESLGYFFGWYLL